MAFTLACTLGSPPGASNSWGARQARLGMSTGGITGGASAVLGRSGILPGPSQVSGGASVAPVQPLGSPSMNVSVLANRFAVQSTTANGGVYISVLETTQTIQVNAADATNPRIDVLVVSVFDDGTTPVSEVKWVTGTAAASPTRPSTTPPTNYHYLTLAEVRVNASPDATIVSGDITFPTTDAIYTAAPGGMVRVPTLALASGLPAATPFFSVQDGAPGTILANGTAELDGLLFRYYSGNISPNGSGEATVTFGQRIAGSFTTKAFPNGFIMGIWGDRTSSIGSLILKSRGGTTSTATVRCYTDAGALQTAGPLTVDLLAIGY